uniref:Cleavage stimulation factor subunit 2 hinge domain-containing protein n=1 Tax=Cannabis sativa TaxID=3483 RepID=A0A803P7W1_CANSA
MAGRQISGDGLPSNLAGMTKSQLYDIMSQMKTLIEQNQQQARQILIQNPLLTKALFQAQIMLGMVQPPQAIPKIEQPQQHSQQPTQISQQSNIQASQSLSVQVGPKDQAASSAYTYTSYANTTAS